MGPLVEAFGREFPQYRGRVYYETLRPGLLLMQMDAGGTAPWFQAPSRTVEMP
jgi:hypothetical protein